MLRRARARGETGMLHLLDNIFWNTLTGPHAKFATGAGGARRYAPGFSPILGFEDLKHPDFDALAPYCQPGESFYCSGWWGPMPRGWRLEVESMILCMAREVSWSPEDDDFEALRLGPQHAPQALELAKLTNPGPFGPRTLELGEYFGHFREGHLVAMAGERMHAGPLREVSGVCTHPDHQGQGYARRLMTKVIVHQLRREQIPFLHVMSSNERARELYERLGFRDYRETVVRVITPE
jgi:GNAT superfamily N-acetyltransferase